MNASIPINVACVWLAINDIQNLMLKINKGHTVHSLKIMLQG